MLDISWNPSSKELRGFGIVILVGFGLIGLAKTFWPFSWGIKPQVDIGGDIIIMALCIGIPSILGWRIILPAYWAWMGFAFVLHKIMFPVTFGLFYYLMFTPMRLILTCVGHDPLKLKRRQVDSYWTSLSQEETCDRHERQY